MRDGFNFQGIESDTKFGSFGHKKQHLAVGARSGIWAAFVAGQIVDDNGFRDFSEAQIRRMYADLGVKNDGAEFHINYTGADNEVGVTSAAPVTLLETLGWARSFTSPQTTDNNMSMVSLNGSVKATPDLTFSGVGYYRWFKQSHLDGNLSDFGRCANGVAGFSNPNRALCLDGNTADDVVLDQNGNPLGVLGAGRLVLGHPLSYDHGSVLYTASSELGFFGPGFVVSPFNPPVNLTAPDDLRPRRIGTTNDYVGVYFSNTTDLTKQLSLTLGGRWNCARIDILNENPAPTEEDKLTGTHKYYRFNPMAGATYLLAPGLTLYGGYSEANRAPTAAELACADPDAPCLIESFLTADPPLKQVVSRTFEAGLRGKLASLGGDQRLEWTAGLFRTENQDDIISISASTGRGYFKNAGDTLRQGVELGAEYQDRYWDIYANYAYIDATFRTPNVLSSPNNTLGFDCTTGLPTNDDDAALCIQVEPGDHLPGIPRHRFKIGADYRVKHEWRIGGDLVAVSSQYFFGDEANLNPPLSGYAKVDVRSSYDITKDVQIYGLIDNLFDKHYGLFGNYFNQEAANNAAAAAGLPANFFGTFQPGNPQKNETLVPGLPRAYYGGIKIKF
jgi:iron complex outermembrane receptor protein